ncbi:MAG: hypothetical protein JWM11_7459 [Planctomycetaceae bacterium]|nr:hypothetical protein [Planctomycetaceae bacterium]
MTFTAVAVFFLAGTPILQGQPATSRAASVSESELPYNQQPISYSERTPDDAISRLQNQLDEGEIKIKSTGKQGFLLDLLRALDIPISSQLLVFSKSSANARLITPQSPRAVYFNDDVYVGWVPGSAMIEISAVDPIAGGMFYHLKQSPDQNDVAAPLRGNSIQRDESCLLCHISRNSLRVPGHLVRSFTTDSEGQMRTGWSRVTHDTPYYNRWAGWYVTGEVGRLKHLGNVYGDPPEQKILIPGDLKRYLAATSDVVPHLVLEHQAQGHNLITRLNYEARLSIPITAADPLLRYLLFVDEAPLTTPVRGILDYQKWFEARGPRDNQGRSLRQFDLQTRMFKYRMSFLIYSAAFDALPDPIRLEFFRDLKSWLTTTDAQHPATRLPIDERQAILQILRETKPGLPKDW